MSARHLDLRGLFSSQELYPETRFGAEIVPRFCPGVVEKRRRSFLLCRRDVDWYMLCEGQRLAADAEVTGIGFAGCGIWGEQKGEALLRFADGTRRFQLHFPDWCNPVSQLENYEYEQRLERQAGKILYAAEVNGQGIYTYYQWLNLPKPRRLREIELPDNLFLLVRAVTLEVWEGESR